MIRTNSFYPLLPPFMDAPANHPQSNGTTQGPSVFIVKCLLLGTPFDEGYALNTDSCLGFKATTMNFQRAHGIDPDGNFGQDTRLKFYEDYGINLDKIPHSILRMPDFALQPNSELIMWPPGEIIISADKNLRTAEGFYRLLPPYLDWPKAHRNPIGVTAGPSVFIVKCLLLGTSYWERYNLDTAFCDKQAQTIIRFQKDNGLEPDGCFGQDTRTKFLERYGRNLEAIPRKILMEPDTAIQPDGKIISWPPKIVLA